MAHLNNDFEEVNNLKKNSYLDLISDDKNRDLRYLPFGSKILYKLNSNPFYLFLILSTFLLFINYIL